MLVAQLEEGRAEVENQYCAIGELRRQPGRAAASCARCSRFPTANGAASARSQASGYRLREEYAAFDAERVFDVEDLNAEEPKECISALVLQGLKKPVDCPAFGTRCTPMTPLGAPMVSAEGACAAYYQYRRHA